MESQIVRLAAEAKPVSIRAFGELSIHGDTLLINDQILEQVIIEQLGLSQDGMWDSKRTLASVRIEIEPFTAGDIKTIVNGKPYPAPAEETVAPPAEEAKF